MMTVHFPTNLNLEIKIKNKAIFFLAFFILKSENGLFLVRKMISGRRSKPTKQQITCATKIKTIKSRKSSKILWLQFMARLQIMVADGEMMNDPKNGNLD